MNPQSTMQEILAIPLIKRPLCRKSRSSKLSADSIKVMFLPFNMILLIQPLEQGTIPTLLARFLRKMFNGIMKETKNDKMLAKQFWSSFTISDAIIADA
jgi:hypothetical protein